MYVSKTIRCRIESYFKKNTSQKVRVAHELVIYKKHRFSLINNTKNVSPHRDLEINADLLVL